MAITGYEWLDTESVMVRRILINNSGYPKISAECFTWNIALLFQGSQQFDQAFQFFPGKKGKLDVKDLEAKIKKLEKMDIIDYLNYSRELYKQKKEKEENIEEESTIDESIEKIIK